MTAPDSATFAAAREQFQRGLAALQAGQSAEAEAAFRASLALLPGRPSTQVNLGVALLRQGRAAEALPLLDAVLAAQPDDVDALGHRGVALMALQRPAEAGQAFERVLKRAPERPEAWFHHGQVLQMGGRHDAALASYERCLALAPAHGRALSQRGSVLHELGRDDEAAASWQAALEAGDDAELNRYLLASLRRGPVPPASPRGWVQGLFDDYAADFDRHLVDELGYRAPEVLARLLVASGRAPFADALDLGCGTGLMAPLLRPMVERLHGVDLSGPMLDAARARGLYDRLTQGDLVEQLAAEPPATADLVVAADVFIYIGDLAPAFAGLGRVLRTGGLCAFSIEPAPAGEAWVLQPSLRYAQGEAALRALAAAHGLQVQTLERGVLRQEQGQDVPGQFWLLQRA
ncbi:MAG: tetratricopeptide repeat protein [Rubrivivax sp.]